MRQFQLYHWPEYEVFLLNIYDKDMGCFWDTLGLLTWLATVPGKKGGIINDTVIVFEMTR